MESKMAIRRIKVKARKKVFLDLTQYELNDLFSDPLQTIDSENPPFPNERVRRDTWIQRESALIEEFAKRFPGRRPYLFWELSAKEPRLPGEDCAEYLLRTKQYFPHEEEVLKYLAGWTQPVGLLSGNEHVET
jgi:hypothetical protein